MKTSEGASPGPDRKVIEDNRPKPAGVSNGSAIVDLFRRFLSLEKEATVINGRKAEVFAEAKGVGIDSKAMRAAFRQRVREIENLEATTIHDNLTESYLAALRSGDGNSAKGGGPHRASPGPRRADPDPHARSRTREGASDVPNGGLSKVASSNDLGSGQLAAKGSSRLDDEPDIPDGLRAKPN